MHETDRIRLAAVWQQAAVSLDLSVTAPFEFTVEGRHHRCIALVSGFGGPNGIVLMGAYPPDFELDRSFAADAEQSGYRWSFLNVCEYAAYDEDLVKEALKDWGYTGDIRRRPHWLKPA